MIKPQGTVGPILDRLRDGEYRLLFSDPLLAELEDVLNSPRNRDKYALTLDDIGAVPVLILLRGEPVTPARRIEAGRDPKDNLILEAAVAGQADWIVSGDDDLLELGEFEGIPVVGPSRFLGELEGKS